MVLVELGGKKSLILFYSFLQNTHVHARAHTHVYTCAHAHTYTKGLEIVQCRLCYLNPGCTGSVPQTLRIVSPVSLAVWITLLKISRGAMGSLRVLMFKINKR